MTENASPLGFIFQHSAFRLEELEAAYRSMGRPASNARKVLQYHVARGRLVNVRRGVYATIEFVDPWLLASKMAKEVVISHDGALSFHGLTGMEHQVSYMTTERTTGAIYQEMIYAPLRVTESRLQRAGAEHFEREGQPIWVTSVARTLVDCLSLLERAPPPIELMGIFIACSKSADANEMIRHAYSFDSPLLVTRLAFFLTCARFDLRKAQWEELARRGVKDTTSFLRSARTDEDCSVPRWKLIVPPDLHQCWLNVH